MVFNYEICGMGLFLFGGSTVIVIGEKGRWGINPDILKNTAQGIESYLKMGCAMGASSQS